MSLDVPTCPLCGGPIHDSGQVLADADGCVVFAGGRGAHLSRQHMTLFLALWRNRPRVQSAERLLYLTAPESGDDEREPNLISVQMSRLRAELAPLGIEIETVRGMGWRILHKAA